MDQRSGLVNIFSAIRSLPQGHDKPVKQALYNTVALFMLMVCCAAGYALYIIFQPFMKPLMWALLVGSTLHPLKRSLRDRFQTWFQNLEINNTPIVFGVILVPVNIVNDVSEFIGKHTWKRLKLIIVIGIIVPIILLIYNYTPKLIVKVLWRLVLLTFRTLNSFIDASSIWLVGLILIAYISMVFILWRPDNNKKFHYSSIVMWIFGSSCLAKQFGYYQLPIFILLQIVIFGGFISEVYEHYKTMKENGKPITLPESVSQVFHESHVIEEEEIVDSSKEEAEEDDIVKIPPAQEKREEVTNIIETSKDPLSLDLFENTNPIVQQKPKLLKRSLSQPYFSSKSIRDSLRLGKKISYSHTSLLDTESCSSTFYLISVMWACIVMFFWKNVMFLLLLPFPILYYIIKHLGNYIGLWSYLYEKSCDIFEKIASWCHERHDALVPVPIRGLYNIIHKLNSFLKNAVKSGIDTVASCVVIFSLIIFLICTSVFIAFQIYAEAIMLVEMTASLINQTIVHNPELKQLLPPSYYNVDAFLDNTYRYGREGISQIVKGSMINIDSSKSEQLEKQILELWDRVYQNWMSTNDSSHGPKVTDDAVLLTWNSFIEDLQKSPEMFNINGLMEFGQQNIGTVMSLLESVLGILKGNISLIFGSFTTLITVIFDGGTAVINFTISLVVFFTALFYLLHSSGDLYKPVELLTNFSPSGMRLGHALEGAIRGVFSATFKMSAFYGMWTWFIHNLFAIRIVYLPTVFAAILGAIPFLGTYWAGVPAILNLWLAQDRAIEAIIFAVFQFLPTYVVDTTIYKEIKGSGHPYLTGLAIAGGIISLGMEGAIIGPMLLCGLYVAIELSSTLFKETPSEEILNFRLRQLQNT